MSKVIRIILTSITIVISTATRNFDMVTYFLCGGIGYIRTNTCIQVVYYGEYYKKTMQQVWLRSGSFYCPKEGVGFFNRGRSIMGVAYDSKCLSKTNVPTSIALYLF